jgi:hypothetical protein
MDELDRFELTANERRALAELPRERAPSPLLEERTLRALRQRGLIAPRRAGMRMRHTGLLAASIALFASGVLVGRSMAGEPGAAPVASEPATADAAVHVQRTGSAYVDALSIMVQTLDAADAVEREQAWQVAAAPLRAAATEVVRIAPDDPLARRIVYGLETEAGSRGVEPGAPVRHVVWF